MMKAKSKGLKTANKCLLWRAFLSQSLRLKGGVSMTALTKVFASDQALIHSFFLVVLLDLITGWLKGKSQSCLVFNAKLARTLEKTQSFCVIDPDGSR